jgi:hypothetical protein
MVELPQSRGRFQKASCGCGAGGSDSSAIGVPTGIGGFLKNGGIAADSWLFSKGFLRPSRPDSGAIGATRCITLPL